MQKQLQIHINAIYTVVWIIVMISTMLLIYSCGVYEVNDVIQSYEEQIRLVQDKSLIETIKDSSIKEHVNEVSGESRITITTGDEYKVEGIYKDTGTIVDLKTHSNTGSAIVVCIIGGSMLGAMLSCIACMGVDYLIEVISNAKN